MPKSAELLQYANMVKLPTMLGTLGDNSQLATAMFPKGKTVLEPHQWHGYLWANFGSHPDYQEKHADWFSSPTSKELFSLAWKHQSSMPLTTRHLTPK
jgi:hypothetical protein